MRDYFEPREVAAKTVVLRVGEISRRVFYVAKGCLRVWFNTIESIEPATVRVLKKKDYDAMMADRRRILGGKRIVIVM